MSNLNELPNLKKNKILYIITSVILLSGTALRLFHYIYNRSLWMDEIYLCSSFPHMGYIDLATKVLDYQQKAPIGFLWLVKLSLNLFGNNETVLRLIPFIAGIISLFLFNRICKYYLKPWGQVIAISIFAFAPAIVYHSVEIKQYSTECLATIIALYLFIRYKNDDRWKAKFLWGISGGILVWFSFSVIFILAGIGTGLSLYLLIKKDFKLFFAHLVSFLIWLISFAVNFIFFTHKHAESEWVVYFFSVYGNFMPFPPVSIEQLKWFPRNFIDMMDYPLGLVWSSKMQVNNLAHKILITPFFPTILLFCGMLSVSKYNRKDFYILIFPVLFMLFASGLHRYPLIERFWVFIAPVFMLFIAMGFDYFRIRLKTGTLISILLSVLVLSGPFIQSVYSVFHPEQFYKHKKSFERESLVEVNNNFQEGDVVYNYWNNAPGYRVYKNICHFKFNMVEGQDFRKRSKDLADYNRNLNIDFKKFAGKKRVWLIYNTQFLTDIGDKIDDPKWYYRDHFFPINNLLREFNNLGTPLKKIVYTDVTVCLFKLK